MTTFHVMDVDETTLHDNMHAGINFVIQGSTGTFEEITLL